MLVAIFGFCFGAFLGSFLNVCVHRIPRNESVVQPRSRCYACGTQVQAYDNIPIISYFLLRGKCRWCGTPYSSKYVWAEVMVALLTALVCWWGFGGGIEWIHSLVEGRSWNPWVLHWAQSLNNPPLSRMLATASMLTFICYLYVSSMIDAEHTIIPDELTKSFQLLAPGLALLVPVGCWPQETQALTWYFEQRLDGPVFQLWSGTLAVSLVIVLSGIALFISLPISKWIYGSRLDPVECWRDQDHIFFARGVWWFGGCSLLWLVLYLAWALGLTLTGSDQHIAGQGLSPGVLAHMQLGQALLGFTAGWWSLYGVGLFGSLVFRRNAMGFGDVKFLAPIGAMVGPVGVPYIFFLGAVAAMLVGIPKFFMKKELHIPFGPFLAFGSMVVLFAGYLIHPWLMDQLFPRF